MCVCVSAIDFERHGWGCRVSGRTLSLCMCSSSHMSSKYDSICLPHSWYLQCDSVTAFVSCAKNTQMMIPLFDLMRLVGPGRVAKVSNVGWARIEIDIIIPPNAVC